MMASRVQAGYGRRCILFDPYPRILIVDDDQDLLRALGDTLSLRFQAMTIDCVASVDAALSRLEQQPYQLVISDVQMPRATGLDLLKRLREATTHAPPVILVTGEIEETLDARAIQEGAVALVRKPFDRHAFTSLIQNIIDKAD